MSTLVDQAASASTSWALRLAGLGEFEASNSSPEQIAQARALYSQVLKVSAKQPALTSYS